MTLKQSDADSVKRVMMVLLTLQAQEEWEVRHGGLMGLKYLMAVRQVRAVWQLKMWWPLDIEKGLLEDTMTAMANCREHYYSFLNDDNFNLVIPFYNHCVVPEDIPLKTICPFAAIYLVWTTVLFELGKTLSNRNNLSLAKVLSSWLKL